MNTLSIVISTMGVSGSKSMYANAFFALSICTSLFLPNSSGVGIVPVTSDTIAGFVPQLT